ncbi:uncharacterized protein si:ch73-43g23.1 [Stegostoma tigrinum]|uniref:uncharacterized protein si:ch73-43g23.1 n=1 Tax=Stegostoma tigrinum TaxID=3053191 RepID=UPI00202AEB8F|nr:uncharacterized protein si:ch73-43g23.1 [Stegostoma tigrinum]XP_048399456.1 uncharacterized protein si:ch73-43g23.1 [Stegostoma tigrinum]
MNYLDEEVSFVKKTQESTYIRRNESEVGSKLISEIWPSNPCNNSSEDISFISDDTAARIESSSQVLTEDNGQTKVNKIPNEHSVDPDCINNILHGDLLSIIKIPSESPLFPKADDTPCDSSGSYHTAMCSEISENLSDCSGQFKDIEENPTDYDVNQDTSNNEKPEHVANLQTGKISDLLNGTKIASSLNDCTSSLQSYCYEGQEQIFMNKHKKEFCKLNAERETFESDEVMKICRLEKKNETDVDSDYKKNERETVKIADEYETTTNNPLKVNNACTVVVPDDTSLTTNSNAYCQGIFNGSTEYDLSVKGTDTNVDQGNRGQQVQSQNSQIGDSSSTVQLTKIQKAGISLHESPSCYLHLGLNEPGKIFRTDTFENDFKNDSSVDDKKVYAECVSETSSAASDLDETDYEVQKLTALAFRSLSCPNDDYLDIYNSRMRIDFSSPLSAENEQKHRLSPCNELCHNGLFDSNEDCSDSKNKALHAEAEEDTMLFDDSFDREQCIDVVVESHDKSKDLKSSRTVPKRQIEFRKRQRSELKVFTSRCAIKSCVCIDPGDETENKETLVELQKCENIPFTENIKDEDTIDSHLQRPISTVEPLTKNKFASYIITNVISKKMQFEQGLKTEHGLNKITNSISSTPTLVKEEDCDLPTMVSQQVQHEDPTSESETLRFIQGNCKMNSCEFDNVNIEENGNEDQKYSLNCLICDSGPNLDGKKNKNKNILNCYGKKTFRNCSECNTGIGIDNREERAFESHPEKPHPEIYDLSTKASEQEKNFNAPYFSECQSADYTSQVSEEEMTLNDRMQTKQKQFKEKTSDIQSGNTSSKIETTSHTLMLTTPYILHNSQKANAKQMKAFSIAKENSTVDSNTTGHDPMHGILPPSFELKSGLEQDKVSWCNVNDNITMKNATKLQPSHVRDARKPAQNAYSALTFCTVKAQSAIPNQVHNSSSFEQSLSATKHKISPIFIECQSISRKSDKHNNSYSIDKNYWTCTGSSDISRIFSSDFQLPIPSNKQKNKVISAKRIKGTNYSMNENGNNTTEHLTCHSNKTTSERNIKALSISNNEKPKLSSMKVKVGAEDQKEYSGNFVLNSEIADFVPEKDKQNNEFQQRPENSNSHLSCSTTKTKSSEMPISKIAHSGDIQSELDIENRFTMKSDTNKKRNSMVFCKDVTRSEKPNRVQDQTALLRNSPLNTTKDSSQRKHRPEKDTQTELENQNNQLGIFNEHIELSNKNNPFQSDSQVNIKNQNPINSNKGLGSSSWEDDPGNMTLGNQNKCFRLSNANDKETQTPPRKGKHKKAMQLRLEKQNKISEHLTLDNEVFVVSNDKHELKKEPQVSLGDQNKLSKDSTFDVEGDNSSHDYLMYQEDHQQNNQGVSDDNVLPNTNMHENEMQRRSQNEAKSLYSLSSNCKEIKLSPINCNRKGEIHDVMENPSSLLTHCMQNSGNIILPAVKSKIEKEFEIEHNAPKSTGKVEMIQKTEKVGLTFISELQPFKDNNALSIVSEVDKQSTTKDCAEFNINKVADVQISSVQVQTPNDISLIPIKTTGNNHISVESPNYPETIKISSNTSFQENENQDAHDKSTLSFDIHKPTVNKLSASQVTSSFKNLKLLESIQPDSKLSTKIIGNETKQQSLEMNVVTMNNAFTQEEASVSSDRANYLTIPVKEHKSQALVPSQMSAPPQPIIPEPGHYSTITSLCQQTCGTLDPHKQEQQTLPQQIPEDFQSFGACPQPPLYTSAQVPQHTLTSTEQMSNTVPQSPHFSVNPQFPCFQYILPDKKMLIDPETGKHYFIETPVHSPRKLLLDPETGCYIEIIIPQQPYSGSPFSPYVLCPSALRPSFIPSMQCSQLFSSHLPTYSGLSPETPDVQMQSNPKITTDKQDHKNNTQNNLLVESNCMENAYYIPTGMPVKSNPAQSKAVSDPQP